jgi:hypothetical protein
MSKGAQSGSSLKLHRRGDEVWKSPLACCACCSGSCHPGGDGVLDACSDRQIFGVLFVAIGLMIIFRSEAEDQYHNLLHLATGVAALWLGFAGSPVAARVFCVGFGLFYLGFGMLGLMAGDPAASRLWHVGPFHLDSGDHVFHIVLGSIFLASGGRSAQRAINAAS